MTTLLRVNINEECSAALQAYASANKVTVTEATRRAISLLNLLDVQHQFGRRLAAVDADGKVALLFEVEGS